MEESAGSVDFKELRAAIADAAGVSTGLWVSYLFVLFYLLVAVGGVTHADLFRESPVRLPFLGVDLPLKGFFWLGPLLFIVVHAYVLLHLVLFAAKARAFVDQVDGAATTADQGAGERVRQQLPINAFVQLLAGPREARCGTTGLLLRSIVWISLVFGPVALLVFFQLSFLPYHDEWVTNWQRLAIVVDLALLWLLWPAIVRGKATGPGWRRMASGRVVTLGAVTLITVPFVFGIATFPGERLEVASFPLRRTLIAGDFDEDSGKPRSLLWNRLLLSGIDVVDHAKFDTPGKIASAPTMAVFRKRRLEGAVLIEATLPRVDFTGARLDGARFTRARLQGAWFDNAMLSGAKFDEADLQGASFYNATLHAAWLSGAHLQGASMASAQLRGAWLNDAQLQGASLASADLWGASLEGADLRAADLSKAQLQGASFVGAKLQGASLAEAKVWRANFRNVVNHKPAVLVGRYDRTTPLCEPASAKACDPAALVADLKRVVELYMPERSLYMPERGARTLTLHRLDRILDPATPPPEESEIENSWKWIEHTPVSAEEDEAPRHYLWRELACAADGAPFVAIVLVGKVGDDSGIWFKRESPVVSELADELRSKDCAAHLAMTIETEMQLTEFHEFRRPAAGPMSASQQP